VGAELPRHPTGPHAIKSLLPKLRLVHHAAGVAAVKGELVRISGASAQTTVRDSLRLALIAGSEEISPIVLRITMISAAGESM
jgi:hypothetical protein